VQAVLILPTVVIGLILPLDFIYQADGYRKYMSFAAMAHLFVSATFLYTFLALIMTALLSLCSWIISFGTKWSLKFVLSTVFEGIAASAYFLFILGYMKLWIQRMFNDAINFSSPRWALGVFVLIICMLIASILRTLSAEEVR
jgi:hypothetical protein